MGVILRDVPPTSELHMSKSTKLVVLGLSVLLASFVVAGGLGVKAATNDGALTASSAFSAKCFHAFAPSMSKSQTFRRSPMVLCTACLSRSTRTPATSLPLNIRITRRTSPTAGDDRRQRLQALWLRRGDLGDPRRSCDKAGIDSGDIVEAIESKSTREMSLAEIHRACWSEMGSNVNLSVVRARRVEPLKLTITRDNVKNACDHRQDGRKRHRLYKGRRLW